MAPRSRVFLHADILYSQKQNAVANLPKSKWMNLVPTNKNMKLHNQIHSLEGIPCTCEYLLCPKNPELVQGVKLSNQTKCETGLGRQPFNGNKATCEENIQYIQSSKTLVRPRYQHMKFSIIQKVARSTVFPLHSSRGSLV